MEKKCYCEKEKICSVCSPKYYKSNFKKSPIETYCSNCGHTFDKNEDYTRCRICERKVCYTCLGVISFKIKSHICRNCEELLRKEFENEKKN